MVRFRRDQTVSIQPPIDKSDQPQDNQELWPGLPCSLPACLLACLLAPFLLLLLLRLLPLKVTQQKFRPEIEQLVLSWQEVIFHEEDASFGACRASQPASQSASQSTSSQRSNETGKRMRAGVSSASLLMA